MELDAARVLIRYWRGRFRFRTTRMFAKRVMEQGFYMKKHASLNYEESRKLLASNSLVKMLRICIHRFLTVSYIMYGKKKPTFSTTTSFKMSVITNGMLYATHNNKQFSNLYYQEMIESAEVFFENFENCCRLFMSGAHARDVVGIQEIYYQIFDFVEKYEVEINGIKCPHEKALMSIYNSLWDDDGLDVSDSCKSEVARLRAHINPRRLLRFDSMRFRSDANKWAMSNHRSWFGCLMSDDEIFHEMYLDPKFRSLQAQSLSPLATWDYQKIIQMFNHWDEKIMEVSHKKTTTLVLKSADGVFSACRSYFQRLSGLGSSESRMESFTLEYNGAEDKERVCIETINYLHEQVQEIRMFYVGIKMDNIAAEISPADIRCMLKMKVANGVTALKNTKKWFRAQILTAENPSAIVSSFRRFVVQGVFAWVHNKVPISKEHIPETLLLDEARLRKYQAQFHSFVERAVEHATGGAKLESDPVYILM